MAMPSQRIGTMTLVERPDGDYLVPRCARIFSDKKLIQSIAKLIERGKPTKPIGLNISKTSLRLEDEQIPDLMSQVKITSVRMVGCRRLKMSVPFVDLLVKNCPNLTTCVLGLSTYKLETMNQAKILLQRLPKLRHMAFVDMNDVRLLKTLLTLDEPVRLESLCLSHSLPPYSFFEDDLVSSLAFDSMMSNLSSLNLSHNNVTGPEGLVRLLQNTNALKRLCLEDTEELTDDVISVITQNKGLVYLNLHEKEFLTDSATATKAIAKMVASLPKLETLSLGVILDDDSEPIDFLDVCEAMQDTFPKITCLRVCVPGKELSEVVKSRWRSMLTTFPKLKSLILVADEDAKMKSFDYIDFLTDTCRQAGVQLKMPLMLEEEVHDKTVPLKQYGWETDNYFLK